MKAGLVADLIVAALIIINLALCTRMGFVRCIVKYFSVILSFTVAILTAAPLANFCDEKFGWGTAVANWNIPFLSGSTLLKLLVGIAVFILMRLICMLFDKFLAHLKDKLKAVNIIDRILGTVFGAIVAILELTFLFMLIDQLGWESALSLTEDGGGFLAYRLFEFCRNYMFGIVGELFAAGAAGTPKI